MEVPGLNGTQVYADYFRQSILDDIPYWQDYLANVVCSQDEANSNKALQKKRDQIIKHIQFALDLDVEAAWGPTQTLVETFSPYMERWGYWGQWQAILIYALKMAQHRQDQKAAVKVFVLLARLSGRQNDFPNVVANYRSAIRVARQIDDLESEARACSNLGYTYIELGYWWRAEILCRHALAIFDHLDHAHGQAHTENHLGVLFFRRGMWSQVLPHLERACLIWQSMGDKHGLMRGYTNLGALHNSLEDFDKALAYFEQALRQAKLTGEEIDIGIIYMNIGNTLRLRGELSQAEKYYWQAEAIFQRFSNSQGLALLFGNLGLAYSLQQKWSDAFLYLNKALEKWRVLGNTYGEIQATLDFAAYGLARDDRGQAIAWLNEAKDMLSHYDPSRRFRRLYEQVDKIGRNLAE